MGKFRRQEHICLVLHGCVFRLGFSTMSVIPKFVQLVLRAFLTVSRFQPRCRPRADAARSPWEIARSGSKSVLSRQRVGNRPRVVEIRNAIGVRNLRSNKVPIAGNRFVLISHIANDNFRPNIRSHFRVGTLAARIELKALGLTSHS